MRRFARPSFPVTARRLALVACLIAGLLSLSAGSAMAKPHAKRVAKACKQATRAAAVARPTPIRAGNLRKRARAKRARRNRIRCARVMVRRRVVAPRSPAGNAPSAAESPQSGTPAGPAPGATPPAEAPGDTTAPLPPSNPYAVQVLSGEFFLRLSKAEVHAGDVRVEFNNSAAEDPHDLHVVRSDGTGASYSFGELQSGEVEAKTLRLNAGSWRLFCALPEHAQRGMSVKLRVAAG